MTTTLRRVALTASLTSAVLAVAPAAMAAPSTAPAPAPATSAASAETKSVAVWTCTYGITKTGTEWLTTAVEPGDVTATHPTNPFATYVTPSAAKDVEIGAPMVEGTLGFVVAKTDRDAGAPTRTDCDALLPAVLKRAGLTVETPSATGAVWQVSKDTASNAQGQAATITCTPDVSEYTGDPLLHITYTVKDPGKLGWSMTFDRTTAEGHLSDTIKGKGNKTESMTQYGLEVGMKDAGCDIAIKALSKPAVKPTATTKPRPTETKPTKAPDRGVEAHTGVEGGLDPMPVALLGAVAASGVGAGLLRRRG